MHDLAEGGRCGYNQAYEPLHHDYAVLVLPVLLALTDV